jgi:hypothetical protein
MECMHARRHNVGAYTGRRRSGCTVLSHPDLSAQLHAGPGGCTSSTAKLPRYMQHQRAAPARLPFTVLSSAAPHRTKHEH